jgi:hypothetical protein
MALEMGTGSKDKRAYRLTAASSRMLPQKPESYANTKAARPDSESWICLGNTLFSERACSMNEKIWEFKSGF